MAATHPRNTRVMVVAFRLVAVIVSARFTGRIMGEFENDDWRGFLRFFSIWLGCAAIIYLGSQCITLHYDLKKSQCAAAYWKARMLGHPSSYCPTGCQCDLWMLR